MSGKNQALAARSAHLGLHRRLILTRSLAAGAAGMVPVPYLDDWLVTVVRRGTIRRIAEARKVDIDDKAVNAVAEGIVPPPSVMKLLGSTALSALFRRALRRALLVWSVARRADDARRSFVVATLFDHYCTRLHVGGALDEAQGRRVRAAIDEALRRAPTGIATRVFVRALAAGGRAALRAPFQLVDGLSGGLVRKALRRGDEAQAEEVVEEAVARAEGSNAFARAYNIVDGEMARAGNGWLDDLIRVFEAAWRRAAEDPAPRS